MMFQYLKILIWFIFLLSQFLFAMNLYNESNINDTKYQSFPMMGNTNDHKHELITSNNNNYTTTISSIPSWNEDIAYKIGEFLMNNKSNIRSWIKTCRLNSNICKTIKNNYLENQFKYFLDYLTEWNIDKLLKFPYVIGEIHEIVQIISNKTNTRDCIFIGFDLIKNSSFISFRVRKINYNKEKMIMTFAFKNKSCKTFRDNRICSLIDKLLKHQPIILPYKYDGERHIWCLEYQWKYLYYLKKCRAFCKGVLVCSLSCVIARIILEIQYI